MTIVLSLLLLLSQEVFSKDLNFYIHNSQYRNYPSPLSYDLRKSGLISSPIQQAKCGACYLSAASTILEYWTALPFSAQTMLECSDFTCSGGMVSEVLNTRGALWVEKKGFKGFKDKCLTTKDLYTTGLNVTVDLKVSDQNLQHIVWKYGPVATYMHLNNKMAKYKGGVLDSADCTAQRPILHAVNIVGYTPDYWIIKSSWGTQWGVGGFAYVRRGYFLCNIGARVDYLQEPPQLYNAAHISLMQNA